MSRDLGKGLAPMPRDGLKLVHDASSMRWYELGLTSDRPTGNAPGCG